MPIPVNAPRVDRTLLRDDVFLRLRDAIIDGTLEPGEQLKDGELADWLGVSRTPVREALLRLGQGGLVVAKPGRSTVVSTLDLRAARDARDVVAAMHELAVRESARSLTSEDLSTMREANANFKTALDAHDTNAALRADDALHAVPVKVSGNLALEAVLDQFTPVVRRAERLRFTSLGGGASVERHEALIRLCEEGDAEGAAAVAFDTWHSLPADTEEGSKPRAADD